MPKLHGSRLAAVASYTPSIKVSNEDIQRRAGVDPAWIRERTGVRDRHHADSAEDVVAMAVAAGSRAVATAGLAAADIELVILATSTRPRPIPAGAPDVASRLGITSPGAFDLNAACAGFCYALSAASHAVRVGDAENVLVIGADKVTDWLTPDRPDTYAIFADGAGAAVVRRSQRADIGPTVWGSDGTRRELITIQDGEDHITMRGPLVYRWATANVPTMARRACQVADIGLDEVAWLVPHQANRRIVDTVARALKISEDRVSTDIVDTGNTSAASIPIALSRLVANGRAKSGDWALLIGFGAGLTLAGQVVRLP